MSFLDTILQRAEKQGSQLALHDESSELTYSELLHSSRQIAWWLKEHYKLGSGDWAVLCLPRTTDHVVAILSVWLTGAGVIPLEEGYPQDRVAYIGKDSGAKLVITAQLLREAREAIGASTPEIEIPQIADDALMLLMYTSGSTGTPKGVLHDARSLMFLSQNSYPVYHVEAGDHVAIIVSFLFVASTAWILVGLVQGAALYIAPDNIAKDPDELADYLAQNGIQNLHIPVRLIPFLKLKNTSLRHAMTGGEKVMNICPVDYTLTVGYGQTETLGAVAYTTLEHPYASTPVTHTIGGVGMYVVDDNGQEAQEGEICLTGVFARSYWNLPEQTEKAFVKNPFKQRDGFDQMVRTGDIGRRQEDGSIVILDRRDWMVKINGQRVELGEVESVVKRVPGVKDAVVKSFTSAHGQVYICAYYIPEKNTQLEPTSLQDEVGKLLPDYMRPAFYVPLEAFPLLPSGKINRKVLESPQFADYKAEYVAPKNEIEERICQAMEKVLGCGQVGRNDDFFYLGGDSIRVMALISEVTDVHLRAEQVYEGRTPAGIARAQKAAEAIDMPIEHSEQKSYPLTASQMGVYLECVASPENTKYNIPVALRFDKEAAAKIDRQKLCQAVEKAINNHAAAHFNVDIVDGQPQMVPNQHIIRVEQGTEAHFVRPFDLKTDPLFRAVIVDNAEGLSLLLDAHHIASDGSSLGVLLREIEQAYRGEVLDEEDASLFDLAVHESKATEAQNEQWKADEAYWHELLAEATLSNNMPEDGFAQPTCPALTINKYLDAAALSAWARRQGLTEGTLFLGAYLYTLSRFNGADCATVCFAESGRHSAQVMNTLGMLVRTLPISTYISDDMSVADYLQAVQHQVREGSMHDSVPFGTLVQKYELNNDFMFAYQSDAFTSLQLGEAIATVQSIEKGSVSSKLALSVFRIKDQYRLYYEFRSDLLDKGVIDSFGRVLEQVIGQLMTCERMGQIDLLNEAEQARLDGFNPQELVAPKQTVVDMFRAHVAAHPKKIAVVYEDRQYTYEQVDDLTDRLASAIISQSSADQRNQFVGVLLNRSEWMPICAWGIAKSGAAYQPLDATYPEERLQFMMDESEAQVLVADRDLVHLLPNFKGTIIYTDEIAQLSKQPFHVTIARNDAFILMYTSGSTGVPKGTVLEHMNIVAYLEHYVRLLGCDEQTKYADYASFGFDACMQDLFGVLSSGGELHILSESIRLDLPALDDYFIKHGITHTFMTTQVGRQFALFTKCPTLRCIYVGGEKLLPIDMSDKSFVLLNGYGPSECTAGTSVYNVKGEYVRVPIGHPLPSFRYYVVDAKQNRVPVGVPGELVLSGSQVGRGYLKRPEKTAEVFIDSPFANPEGYRTYRTGDVVRILADGMLDFLGRQDGQVKIRGFRIELSEVELAVRDYRQGDTPIKDATVADFPSPNGGRFIAAFIVADEPIDVAALKAFVASQKPPYMVPETVVQLERIPLTPNGKVNKKALPVPTLGEQVMDEAIPATDTDSALRAQIRSILTDIIGTSRFAADANLNMVGLNSLGCVSLSGRLSSQFGVNCDMKRLLAGCSLIDLENIVFEGLVEKLHASSNEASSQESYATQAPLTKTQEGVFVECMSQPETTIYNIPVLLKLDPSIDISRLKQSVVEAVKAHRAMDVELYAEADGSTWQRLGRRPAFTEQDIEELGDGSESIHPKELIRPFALLGTRLFRVMIVHAKDGVYLMVDAHHIIFDGASLLIWMHDVEVAYRGEALTAENYSSLDVALTEQQKRQDSSDLSAAQTYWSNLLAGLDTDFLPPADVDRHTKQGTGHFVMRAANSQVQPVLTFCKEHNVSANGLMCSAFGLVLARYNAMDYSVFTTIYNGRMDSRTTDTVGMLVKTLPVCCDISKNNTLGLAKEISQQLMHSMAADIYSFSEISREYGVKGDVMFIYQGEGFGRETFCGAPCQEVGLEVADEKAPLAIQVSQSAGEWLFTADYDCTKYTEAYVKALVSAIDMALCQMVVAEQLDQISLVSEEQLAILDGFNQTASAFDQTETVVSRFRKMATQYPDHLAVCYQQAKYTYRQLDELTDRLAGYICQQNLDRETSSFISILVSRSEMMPITALGVLKAGFAYQPLDPTYPKERLNFMIHDCQAAFLICDRSLRDLVDEYTGPVLFTDQISALPSIPYSASCQPEDALLLIYTSGTTGQPKGCIIEQRNLLAMIHDVEPKMELSSASRVANFSSFGFDAGTMEIFEALLLGATLFIIPDDIRLDMGALNQYFIDNEITCTSMTTQVGRLFALNTTCKTLRTMMVGGEKLIPFNPPTHFKFFNAYGPSEAIAYISAHHVTDDDHLQPIGRPNRNAKCYVLDKNNNRLPIGACGELVLTGPQVARGYLNRPEKTAEVFIHYPANNPYLSYRTGDIVRMLPTGELDFIGRRDGQVKIRGFRVELQEIESVILSYRPDETQDKSAISEATVQAFDDPAGGKFLAAYIVADCAIDIADLHRFIASQKPSYMVPAVTMQIESLPRNVNRKVDKRKLPKPERQQSAEQHREASSEKEQTICRVMGEVLSVPKVYADDDFFAIGGSSISAVQVVVKLQAVGVAITYKDLFDCSTPALLAQKIAAEMPDGPEEPVAVNVETASSVQRQASGTERELRGIEESKIGTVLLTGATGFLGIHILRELVENRPDTTIYCLVRRQRETSGEERLKQLLFFYFEKLYAEHFGKRIFVIEGDISDPITLPEPVDMIINCAAMVKHFAKEADMMRSNFSGVENLINLAEQTGAKLIQTSTVSVAGESVNGSVPDGYRFTEFDLNIGQSLDNGYIHSKYLAEEAILNAVQQGRIRAKIMRLGNIMARSDDAEFQINAKNSSFLKSFKGYVRLGCCPITALDSPVEFSPVDKLAQAIIMLSSTQDGYTVFHVRNGNVIHLGYFISALQQMGYPIDIVEPEIFGQRLQQELATGKDISDLSSFVAYANAVTGERRAMVEIDWSYSVKALYRLGFQWPITDVRYLETFVNSMASLGYFDN